MNYHNITHDDMNNGDGLRVVVWVSGCTHKCKNCQNPQTWDPKSGIPWDGAAIHELYDQLRKPYISGVTFSGGDPLHEQNRWYIAALALDIKKEFPNKTIWLYTGYHWEDIILNHEYREHLLPYIDVIVEGPFIERLAEVNYHWAGSTNQRVIDVQESLASNEVVLHE